MLYRAILRRRTELQYTYEKNDRLKHTHNIHLTFIPSSQIHIFLLFLTPDTMKLKTPVKKYLRISCVWEKTYRRSFAIGQANVDEFRTLVYDRDVVDFFKQG